MKVKLKKGVRLPQSFALSFMLSVVVETYREYGADCVITSALDGVHKYGSAHYRADALDFRIWTVPEEKRQELKEKISHRLGEDYDVVLHKNHLHAEYHPKLHINRGTQ